MFVISSGDQPLGVVARHERMRLARQDASVSLSNMCSWPAVVDHLQRKRVFVAPHAANFASVGRAATSVTAGGAPRPSADPRAPGLTGGGGSLGETILLRMAPRRGVRRSTGPARDAAARVYLVTGRARRFAEEQRLARGDVAFDRRRVAAGPARSEAWRM